MKQKEIIENEVKSELNTQQKKRYSSTGQYFIKGASHFLLNYNQSLVKDIDFKSIAKKYDNYLSERIEKFKVDTQQATKVMKKANGHFSNLLLISFVILAGFWVLKDKIFSSLENFKKHSKIISTIFENVQNSIERLDDFLRGQTGKSILEQFGAIIENALSFSFFGIGKIISGAMDLFFNGQSSDILQHPSPCNFVKFIFDNLAQATMKKVLIKTNLYSVLELFCVSINDAVLQRADLQQFLVFGINVYKGIEKYDRIATELVNDTTYAKNKIFSKNTIIPANTKWIDENNNVVEQGFDDGEWNTINKKIRQYHINVIQKVAVNYAKSLRLDAFASSKNPFINTYLENLRFDDGHLSVDTEYDWGDHTTLKKLKYGDNEIFNYSGGLITEILSQIDTLQNDFGLGGTQVIKDAKNLVYKYGFMSGNNFTFHPGAQITVESVGQLLYVASSLKVIEGQMIITDKLNKDVTFHNVKGSSHFTNIVKFFQFQLSTDDNVKPVFETLFFELKSGSITGFDYLRKVKNILVELHEYTNLTGEDTKKFIENTLDRKYFFSLFSNIKTDQYQSRFQNLKWIFVDYTSILSNNTFDLGEIINIAKSLNTSFIESVQIMSYGKFGIKEIQNENKIGFVDNYVEIHNISTSGTNLVRYEIQQNKYIWREDNNTFKFSNRDVLDKKTPSVSQLTKNGETLAKTIQKMATSYHALKKRQLQLRIKRRQLLQQIYNFLPTVSDEQRLYYFDKFREKYWSLRENDKYETEYYKISNQGKPSDYTERRNWEINQQPQNQKKAEEYLRRQAVKQNLNKNYNFRKKNK